MRQLEERYLERLSQLYPTIAKASTEIINLQAILNLPKGTEHFITDVQLMRITITSMITHIFATDNKKGIVRFSWHLNYE